MPGVPLPARGCHASRAGGGTCGQRGVCRVALLSGTFVLARIVRLWHLTARGGTGDMLAQWISHLDQVVTGARSRADHASDDDQLAMRVQYHLGRGRRAREAGHPEQGVKLARRALALNPNDPWAHALLGQCLLRSRVEDISRARRALDQARSLDPTNGYFVRLSLEVLHAQRDARGRSDVLSRAWWAGAAVERWLPGGPQPQTRGASALAPADRREPAASRSSVSTASAVPAGRQTVSA
jgi:hypothetical protein